MPRLVASLLAALGLAGCSGSGGNGGDGAFCEPTATHVFDSSFSDTGNVYAALGGLVPPDPPYFQGRFSNGPVTVEYLAAALGTEVRPSSQGGTNHAVGGARTSVPVSFVLAPINAQVAAYLEAETPDPDALYIVRGGANDVSAIQGGDDSITMSDVADAVIVMVENLAAAGAQHFLLVNLPALPTYPEGGAQLVAEYNAALGAKLQVLSADLDLWLLDVHTQVERMKADPAAFGLTNIAEACIQLSSPGACAFGQIDAIADTYLMYDDVHLTTRMHEVFADAAFDLVCGRGT